MPPNKQARRILITSGPAIAQIDPVRLITNHSTGSLGASLTEIAENEGHQVTLLRSIYCTAPEPDQVSKLIPFSDGTSLLKALESCGSEAPFDAVWHAAAVSDYTVDRICDESGRELNPNAKLPSRSGSIALHLKPFVKIISHLKDFFPNACLCGWKYETNGTRHDVIQKALQQIQEFGTHACIANGPAYGNGYAVCLSPHAITPVEEHRELARILLELLEKHSSS